ncbi:hypothetical protein Anas_11276 [Armadillidium nasatum]|uniref:Uncharacterized protein n=1 Tax=Armadillidium nasatum TaxID=96803 RepID=A0A5N5TB61_9CRUS|nr:hypothetical protein Anas_11276 [Armadillidium nasatum]
MDIKRTDCVTNEDQIFMQDLALDETQIKNFYSSINIKDEIEIKDEPLFTNEDCSENGEDFEQSSELNENQV